MNLVRTYVRPSRYLFEILKVPFLFKKGPFLSQKGTVLIANAVAQKFEKRYQFELFSDERPIF